MAEPIPVTFSPSGSTVWVERGTTILDAARRANEPISAPCAGRGVCGGCGVHLLSGSLEEPDEAEGQGLRRAPKGVRLACRARVSGAATVRPVASQGIATNLVLERGRPSVSGGCVAAVDLGTTTVAATLIDAASRVELGRSVVLNRQQAWGADVLSRITAARDGAGDELRRAAEESVREALVAACSMAGECLGAIERLVIAGNTAMSSLLLGADVGPLGAYPFELPYTVMMPLPASSTLLCELAEGARTLVLPPLAGFVGGDALAGILAAGLDSSSGYTLFVDMGTNAELALTSHGSLVVASAAAGPAFEASGLTSGGPATAGAIERVEFGQAGQVSLAVIGGADAAWLCGSGLVSLVAGLRSLGHIDVGGRMLPAGPLADRFASIDGVDAFVVAREGAPGVAADVFLTQNDVRAFQLAKGAVRTAIEMLFERVLGEEALLVREVVVAGSFGGALRIADLVSLGILPEGLSEHVRVVGDVALAGAAMIAVDQTLENALASAIETVRHVDLVGDPGFSARFLRSLDLEPYDTGPG